MSKIFGSVALLAVLLLVTPNFVFAKAPVLAEVPGSIAEPTRSTLRQQRAGLQKLYADLKARVAVHNSHCASVVSGSAADASCSANKSRLGSETAGYRNAVQLFNHAVAAAPMVGTGTREPKQAKPKGLKIKEPPLPPAVAYHANKPSEDILLNALRAGGPSIARARRQLDEYLDKYDKEKKNHNARYALYVLVQLERALFEQRKEALGQEVDALIEKTLMEAIVAGGRRPWPGPTSGPDKLTGPGVLRGKSTELILESLQAYSNDWQGSFAHLNRLADDPGYPHRDAARYAHDRLRKIHAASLRLKKTVTPVPAER